MVHLKEGLWLAHHGPVFSELGIVELKSCPVCVRPGVLMLKIHSYQQIFICIPNVVINLLETELLSQLCICIHLIHTVKLFSDLAEIFCIPKAVYKFMYFQSPC